MTRISQQERRGVLDWLGRFNLSEKEAQKKMREIDKKRSIHYDYYTDQKWGDARNYSISLNSSDLGYERVIDIICTLAKEL